MQRSQSKIFSLLRIRIFMKFKISEITNLKITTLLKYKISEITNPAKIGYAIVINIALY